MAALTTNSRVLHKAGLTSKDVPTSDVDEFIEDAQAFVEGIAERTFSASDSDYNLARAACSDLAAAYCLIRILGGDYSGLTFKEAHLNISSQQDSKFQLIKELLARVRKNCALLAPQVYELRPKSSTG